MLTISTECVCALCTRRDGCIANNVRTPDQRMTYINYICTLGK